MGVLLGMAAAGNIAFHMATFNECPKAYDDLMKDIKEAKTELAKKGIKCT